MKIIIDEREISLYSKCIEIHNLNKSDYSNLIVIEKTTLSIGDISIINNDNKDIVIIERKTLADLMASIKDGRYEEQSHRLIHSTGIHTHNIIYLIEGIVSSLKFKERKLIHSVITSLNHFKGMTVIKTANVLESAEFILSFSDKYIRNLSKKQIPKYSLLSNLNIDNNPITNGSIDIIECNTSSTSSQLERPTIEVNEQSYVNVVKKVKKDNLTPRNIGAVFLSQIPYISSVTANAIMSKYNNSLIELIKAIDTDPNCLNCIETEKDGKRRKIGTNIINNIKLFLLGTENVN